jgi:RHS repeat-associated protein
LCYQYIYDYRNRLIEKKLPQKTWEFIVYDKQDRVMATGPNHAPFSDDPNTGWLINKYDVFNRVAYTGWYSAYYPNSTNRKVMQGLYNAQTNSSETRANTTINFVNTNYTNNTFPTTGFYLLTVNYYDNYNYPGAPVIPSDVELEPVNQNVKNLPTGSWVRVLTSIGEFNAEKAYVLYDKKYRAIRSYNTNYLGGYNQVDNKLDFVGKVLYSQTFHKKDNTVNVKQITNTFTYSPQDRLLRHIHQVDGGVEELISFKTYDELGNLISKNVGGTDITGAIGLQKIDYTYNVKGMLKSINDVNDISTDNDLFAFNIRYDNSDSATPLYNGNISETYWKTANDNNLRKYEYTYDGLNRLTLANYSRPDVVGPVIDSYREEIKYDKNGNITFLNRNGNSDYDITNGATEIDDLEYTYLPNSNRLMKVFDTSNLTAGFKDDSDGITDPIDDFDYDQYGNLVSDENKKIYLIKYNHLNLPIEIKFNNGNYIKYLYNAVGKKIKKDVVDLTVSPQKTEYLDGFQYVNNRLKFFPHAEGFVKYEKVVFGLGTPYATPYIQQSYVYNYTDHLGNVRVSYQLSQVTDEPVIIEENSYYPFGLKHSGYNSSGVINNYKYKFNGMESQDELGANLYDFGARNYDAAIGRWMNMDPHAENSISWSPYNFVNNNPIYYIDPDGNDPTPYEAALMAAHVYGGSKHGLKGGWKVSSLKVDLKDKPEGFKYGIYERTLSNGKKEYTVAFAGTDDIADLGDDLAQVAGLSPQYAAAAKLANQINSMLPNNTLVFTGHSLGGGLSNLSSLVTGRSSKTYNPAWLSAATLKTIKQKPLSKGNYIHNYVNRLDPLDALQRTDMAGRLDLIEHGKRFLVGDFWDNFVDDVYLGHMIDTMLEEMHDGELYDIYSNVFDADFDTDDGRDCFESRERDKDDWYEVSRSPRYF